MRTYRFRLSLHRLTKYVFLRTKNIAHQATGVARVGIPAPVEPVVDLCMAAVHAACCVVDVIADGIQRAAFLRHAAGVDAGVAAVVEVGAKLARYHGE